MKLPRPTRLNVLLAMAGLTLLAAIWPEAADDTASATAQRPPREARHAATPRPAPPSPAAGPHRRAGAELVGSAAAATAPPRPAPAPAPVEDQRSDSAADRAAALAALDTTLLSRRTGHQGRPGDAFVAKSWTVAPPPPPPAPPAPPPPPPPPPQAPPLPFQYMGSMQVSAERTVWYLRQGERLIVAGTGDLIDSAYRIEGAATGQLHFTYLPLNQRQTLSMGVPP